MDFEEIEAQFMALGDGSNEAESVIGEPISTPAVTYYSLTPEELSGTLVAPTGEIPRREDWRPRIYTTSRSYPEDALNQEINDIPLDVTPQPFTPIIDDDGFITNITPENPIECVVIDSGENYSSHTRAIEYGCLNYSGESPREGANYIITNSVPEIRDTYGDRGYVIKDEAGIYYLIGYRGISLQIKGECVEEPVEEDIKLSVNDMLHKLINTFVEHYGEEFVSYPDVDKFTEGEEEFDIIVKYPEIVVTNSVKESITMRDFYVKYAYRIIIYPDKLLIIRLKTYGIRGLYSLDEYLAGYNFSHLSSSAEDWGSFCFGTSQIGTMHSNFTYNSSLFNIDKPKPFNKYIDDIELFIFNMDSYLTWESIYTNPYKYMSSVGKNNRFIHTTSTERLSNEAIRIAKGLALNIFINDKLRNKLIDECFISTDDLFTLDIYRTSLFIDGLYKEEKRNYGISIFTPFKYDPITFEVARSSTLGNMKDYLEPDGTIKRSSSSFDFKGKKVIQKVIDYKIEEPNKEDDLIIINPLFISAFILVINELFINIKYNETIFKPATTSS